MNLKEKIKITNYLKIGGFISAMIFSMLFLTGELLSFEVSFLMLGFSSSVFLLGLKLHGDYKLDLEFLK